MAWFMDTYSQMVGHSVFEIVTGKPVVLGGTRAGARPPASASSTSRGRVRAHRHGPARGARRVQGFGNVGAVAAGELYAIGARVVAVSDHTAGLYDPDGLDIAALERWTADNGVLDGYPDAKQMGPLDVLEVPCEIVIPAARERQITDENAAAPAVQGRRRGRQRADDPGGRDDPARPRHPRRARRARQRRRRDGLLLRVGPGPPALLVGRARRAGAPAPPAAGGLLRVIDAADRLGCDWRMAALSVAIEHVPRRRGCADLPVAGRARPTEMCRAASCNAGACAQTTPHATDSSPPRCSPSPRRSRSRRPPTAGPRRTSSCCTAASAPSATTPPGRAAVVLTGPGRRILTLRKFSIDPGPQCPRLARAALGQGRRADPATTTRTSASSKGNKGNQQYAIPGSVDLRRYRSVIFWCVPFTQTLARANLVRS